MNISLFKTQQYLDWLKEKLYLNEKAQSAKTRNVFRGQVYRCKLGVGIGSEESKERPCVILQYNPYNLKSPNTIVAPITHTESKLPIVIPISAKYNEDGNLILDGNVLLGNIVCVSKARLGDYITDLTKIEMQQVDEAISISLGIKHYYETAKNELKDKAKYIEKLNEIRKNIKDDLNNTEKELSELKCLLEKYHLSDINSLEKLLQDSFKDSVDK